MNLARLNHILIPATSEARDKLRRGWLARLGGPGWWLYRALSEEGWVLMVMSLFIGTAGIEVATTEVYILWAALMGLLVGALAVRPLSKLAAVRIEVRAAQRVAVGAPTTFTVELRNDGTRAALGLRLRGPFLPWDGRWVGRAPRIAELGAGETVRCEMRARFVQRGHHHLDPFSAAALVPLGLTMGPRISTGTCHFVVVPRIAPVARVLLPMGRSYQPGGIANASHTGEAMELMGVRPYRPGDPVRDLHPKTWARIGTPHVREYQQEYFTRIGVIVDNDQQHATEAGFEAAISLAAGVVARLTRGEALIDLLVMGGEVHALTIGRALGTLDQALDVLAAAEPTEAIGNDALLARIDPHLARISCMLIITQSTDDAQLAVADAISRRGIAVRILRVHDDSGPRILAAKRVRIGARLDNETVLDVTTINGERPLLL